MFQHLNLIKNEFCQRCQLKWNAQCSPSLLSPATPRLSNYIHQNHDSLTNIMMEHLHEHHADQCDKYHDEAASWTPCWPVWPTWWPTCQSRVWCRGCGDPSPCLSSAHLLIIILLMITTMKICDDDYDHFDDVYDEDDDVDDYHDDIHWSLEDRTWYNLLISSSVFRWYIKTACSIASFTPTSQYLIC